MTKHSHTLCFTPESGLLAAWKWTFLVSQTCISFISSPAQTNSHVHRWQIQFKIKFSPPGRRPGGKLSTWLRVQIK